MPSVFERKGVREYVKCHTVGEIRVFCVKRGNGEYHTGGMGQAALYTREGCEGKTWTDMCHRPARRGAAHGGDPVCRYSRASPWCGIDLHKRYRLLRAYPNVSRAALHLHSAWPGRPVRNCEMSRPRRRRRLRFFVGRTFRASVKLRNERGLAFDREMDPIYWGYLGPLPCPIFRATTNRRGVTR